MITFALGTTVAQENDAKRLSGDKGIIQSAYKKGQASNPWQQKSALSRVILEGPCSADFNIRGQGSPALSLAAAQ